MINGMHCLVITVTCHDGRFHGLDTMGRAEWPPSPARLFQALVAAASRGSSLGSDDQEALRWLERLPPPVIAAPATRLGQKFNHFMPNNDLDAKGGNPRRIGEVRSATKRYQPRIFDADTPLSYTWSFEVGELFAHRVGVIAKQLYQLGRGVDMAWATAEVVTPTQAEDRLTRYPGAIHRPAMRAAGNTLPCPIQGALDSLITRFEASQQRFKEQWVLAPTGKEPQRTKSVGRRFAQAPKPRFRPVAYASPSRRLLYDLRDGDRGAGFVTWPLHEVGTLVKILRDDCVARLEAGLKLTPHDHDDRVARAFGLCRDATEADKAKRIRIIPLPSIGHAHADHGIRRILVDVPPDCPISVSDIDWALSGFSRFDPSTGAVDWMLTRTAEQTMVGHFGIGEENSGGFRVWHSVTPVALPVAQSHGRASGLERAGAEFDAAQAIRQALRHAGLREQPVSIRVQREPFASKGAMARDFAPNTRFDARRLWHVELTFADGVCGPLIVGNGRYLGLGLFAPFQQFEGIIAFSIANQLTQDTDPVKVAGALRRAVMARVQDMIGGDGKLPVFFTGHEPDGSVARRGERSHLACVFDSTRRRLFVLAPHIMERRRPESDERKHLTTLEAAMRGMSRLRAGTAGVLQLSRTSIDLDTDPLFRPSRHWVTQTKYQPTRYLKRITPTEAIKDDLAAELSRRNLSRPAEITPDSLELGPRGGMHACVTIEFRVAVSGPIVVGRSSNFGGGLFAATP